MVSASSTLLLRASVRFFLKHPAQLLLSILGILLGVAIVTAVLITNASSRTAFTLSADALTGDATHQLIGAEFGVDQTFYAQLRRTQPWPMAPVIEGYLSIGTELFTVLGIDPFADAGLQVSNLQIEPGSVQRLLESGNGLLISERTRGRLSLPTREPLQAKIEGVVRTIELSGVYVSANPAASDGLLITDIAIAQQLLLRGQYIDRVDLRLNADQASHLETLLPDSIRLISANTRSETMSDMTRGFQINLTAMSLLALLVGGFLIHNTMTFSILQRREIFATLRIVGVTASGIFSSILVETVIISLIGSLLGLATGYFLARYLIQLTTQTINDLYFVLHVQQVWLSPGLAISILLLGVASSLIAATASATEAALSSPVQARLRSRLETRKQHFLPRLGIAGFVLMLLGAMLSFWPSSSLIFGFAALMALIIGYGMAIPWAAAVATGLLRRSFLCHNTLTSFAIAGIERSISRTGVAIAALTIAVSATFGVDIMIGSFRQTVDRWLGNTLQSDIYITAPSSANTQSDSTLPTALSRELLSLEGIDNIGSGRATRVVTNVGNINMLVLEPHARSQSGFAFVGGNSDQIWQKFISEEGLLISEPLATKHGLSRGMELTLFTANQGDHAFTIAGIYHDYGSSHGRITLSRATHNQYWQDRDISSVGVNLKSDADIDIVLQQIRATASIENLLNVRSNREIHDTSLEVFDRTFQVTRVLRLLTVGVAFIGIFSALLALQLERAREFAILRATGASRREIMFIIVTQTLVMGLMAGLLALPLGWLMSELLIQVINLRSFGWSMESILPWGSVVSSLWLATSSALLAGLYPAWRLSSQKIANQLRDE